MGNIDTGLWQRGYRFAYTVGMIAFFCGVAACSKGLQWADLTAINPHWKDVSGVFGGDVPMQLAGLMKNEAGLSGDGNIGIIRFYIEGDGRAYVTRSQPSANPTPVRAVGWELARADAGRAVYLARPCMFNPTLRQRPECQSDRYWTDKRFSHEVVQVYVDAVRKLSGGVPVEVVGYSGGAALALATAVELNRSEPGKVVRVLTVAGNVDPAAVNTYHQVTAMPHAVDIAALLPEIAKIPQIHYVGTADGVIVPAIVEDFVRKQGPDVSATVIRVDATHGEGWEKLRF